MCSVLVQHLDGDRERKLSVYSVPELCFCQYLNKPKGRLVGNHCDGLYIVSNGMCDFSICNLTTTEFKPLNLSLSELVTDPYALSFNAYGIGCSPSSNAYKVLLAYSRFHPVNYNDNEQCAILYSLDTDTWKEFQCPKFSPQVDSVYVGGVCYWLVVTGSFQNGPHIFKYDVLSFNFNTEELTIFPLPPPTEKKYYRSDLIEYGEMLGAIGHSHPDEGSSSGASHVWVWEKQSWKPVYTFSLSHFERALALKSGYLLFIEVPCGDDEYSEVHVFNVVTNRWIGSLNMLGREDTIKLFPFIDSPNLLPFGLPATE